MYVLVKNLQALRSWSEVVTHISFLVIFIVLKRKISLGIKVCLTTLET